MNYLISVIVPVYNVEQYLNKCVNSICNQTYKHLEIILVNDGSKDNSGEICDNLKKTDSRITVVHQKNKGLSGARNSGLDIAKGDYISFIDSDDWIELNMYETMLNLSIENDLDIIECDIYRTNTPKKEFAISKSQFLIENKNESILRIIDNHLFSVCKRIYKHSIIKDMRFVENSIYEDMMFTSELIPKISKIGYLKAPFYNYFIENNTSIMHGAFNSRNINSINAVLDFQKNINKNFKDIKVINSARRFTLFFLVHHYRKLFYNKEYDLNLKIRKRLKKLIRINYRTTDTNNIYTKVAKYSPIWGFKIFSIFLKLINRAD